MHRARSELRGCVRRRGSGSSRPGDKDHFVVHRLLQLASARARPALRSAPGTPIIIVIAQSAPERVLRAYRHAALCSMLKRSRSSSWPARKPPRAPATRQHTRTVAVYRDAFRLLLRSAHGQPGCRTDARKYRVFSREDVRCDRRPSPPRSLAHTVLGLPGHRDLPNPVTFGTTNRGPELLGVSHGRSLSSSDLRISRFISRCPLAHGRRTVTLGIPGPPMLLQALLMRARRVESGRSLLALKAYADKLH